MNSRLLGTNAAALLVDAQNRPIVSAPAAPAPDVARMTTLAFLCRAHGRFYHNRRVPEDCIRDAHVVVLLANRHLAPQLAKATTDAQVIAVLERILVTRPWCCYLSSSERRDVARLGAKGSVHVQESLAQVKAARVGIASPARG